MMIDTVHRYSQEVSKYIAVTRPRRFGKTVAANMIAAFFDPSTTRESRNLFDRLEISKIRAEQREETEPDSLECWTYQGKVNVIRMSMLDLITPEITSYQQLIDVMKWMFLEDLKTAYPNLDIRKEEPLSQVFQNTGDRFIFVIDEWDALFETSFMSESEKKEYTHFLRALLKDKWYVYFVYMTGIMPVARYSSGSPLNMFMEFTAFQDDRLSSYFGMTRDEIQNLIERKNFLQPSIDELSFWYDGYIGDDAVHLYNPNSVALALSTGKCGSYWTGTGPMNEVRDIIMNNVQDIRADILRMVAGEAIEIDLQGFDAQKKQVSSRDEILSAMVVYGFLTYHDHQLSIPNHELVLKFQEALASRPLGLNQTLLESKRLVEATLNRDEKKVARMLEELHEDKIPFFHYNDENSLACVVTAGYLSALDRYFIQQEDKAGKGYVDFSFTPVNRTELPIILELKYNHSAKNALQCIHKKEYIRNFGIMTVSF